MKLRKLVMFRHGDRPMRRGMIAVLLTVALLASLVQSVGAFEAEDPDSDAPEYSEEYTEDERNDEDTGEAADETADQDDRDNEESDPGSQGEELPGSLITDENSENLPGFNLGEEGPDREDEREPGDYEEVAGGEIVAVDITVRLGDKEFDLLDGVYIKGMDHAEIAVSVADDGRFDIEQPGEYTVSYEAEVDGETVSGERTISVVSGPASVAAAVPGGDFEALKQAIADAGDGDVIELGALYTFTETITIDKSLIFRPTDNTAKLNSAMQAHHFQITGNGVTVAFEDGIQLGVSTVSGQDTRGGIRITGDDVTIKGANIESQLANVTATHYAVYVTRGSTGVRLEDCAILKNYGSAAMFIEDNSTVDVVNCTFRDNHNRSSKKEGGAVRVQEGSTVLFDGCTFTGNSAMMGGAICAFRSDLVIRDCIFDDNTSSGDSGGAIYAYDIRSLAIDGCTFTGNQSGLYGGAIFANGSNYTATVTDASFADNTANEIGGAIEAVGGNWIITDTSFSGNSAPVGGGIDFYNSTNSRLRLELTEVTMTGNNARTGTGGAVHMEYAQAAIRNSTFSDNFASGRGGAIYAMDNSTVSITDSELTGNYSQQNSGGAIGLDGNSTTLSLSAVTLRGNRAEAGDGGAVYTPALANVTADGTTFSGNLAQALYAIKDSDIDSHNARITNSTFTTGNYGYNNYDINYQNDTASYPVEFITGGGSAVPTQHVQEGGYASRPEDPDYEGYVFDGWYRDEGLTSEFVFAAVQIFAPTKVYAKWRSGSDYTLDLGADRAIIEVLSKLEEDPQALTGEELLALFRPRLSYNGAAVEGVVQYSIANYSDIQFDEITTSSNIKNVEDLDADDAMDDAYVLTIEATFEVGGSELTTSGTALLRIVDSTAPVITAAKNIEIVAAKGAQMEIDALETYLYNLAGVVIEDNYYGDGGITVSLTFTDALDAIDWSKINVEHQMEIVATDGSGNTSNEIVNIKLKKEEDNNGGGTNPGGGGNGGGSYNRDDHDRTRYVPISDDDVPLGITILDETTPLGQLPKTGGNVLVGLLILDLCALAAYGIHRKVKAARA